MKFLLLGAGGLLGRHLHECLASSEHDFLALTHPDLDICDYKKSEEILGREKPDAVINAAAFCSFEGCERNPAHSQKVNLDAPRWWSRACAERGIRLVLFSSDYIFDGKKTTPYTEDDPPSPLSIYGFHKMMLEKELRGVPTNLIFRPSWIFGTGGKTFMSLMPQLFCQLVRLDVASGKKGACLHAADAARSILRMAEEGASGLWNLVHPGETSWEEFAAECLEEMRRRNYAVLCRKIEHMPYEELSSGSGQRPAYSVLDPGKLQSVPYAALPSWQEGLRNFLDRWEAAHPKLARPESA